MLKQYITNSIDDAIANDWIKVYYQPVIRSLTGELCGFESLARWIDPEHGFLSPAQFIGTLEEAELIYKLDIFMIERVCSDIHNRITSGLDMVPVSINLSRLDFLTCDMLEIVENAVDKNDIPRDYIHIEITESMMITDGDFMQDIIKKFRDHGYAVWMDDFGSGYSSLNLLKDFDVDVLKLDMSFLTSMNEKSKAIMRSVITMAKDIGIKTLAEGVETEEEVNFLKEIGCGKLQGYFYGKPMPLEDALANIKEKNIRCEGRKWNAFYDRAEYHVRSTDSPLELISYDGKNFKTLFMNDAYKLQCFDELPDLDEVDKRIYRKDSPLLYKFRSFADLLANSKRQEEFYYSVGGNYLRLKACEVAENDGLHLIKASLTNMSVGDDSLKTGELDYQLRELSHLFVVILLFCPEEQRVTPILGKFRFYKGPEKMDMRKSTEMMANNSVHPNDRKRYSEFMDFSTMGERIAKTDLGVIEEAFRIKNEEGNYRWVTASVLVLPGSNGKEFLYCIKPLTENSTKTLIDHGSSMSSILNPEEYSLLWYNILWGSNIKFFWKDKDRKFRGASKAFLDYFGFDSVDEIIGKCGEDLKCYFADPSYASDENEILNRGNSYLVKPGKSIIDGVTRDTITSKLPVYLNGEIVGIMGYIFDVEEARDMFGLEASDSDIDESTGLMNVYSFVKSLVDYSQQYESLKQDYGVVLIKNLKSDRILEDYGPDIAESVVQRIAEEIVDEVGQTGAAARVDNSIFAILTFAKSKQELIDIAEGLKEKIDSINSVDNMSVTLKTAYSVRFRSDEGITSQNIYSEALEELQNL